jgi:hypothetical protein
MGAGPARRSLAVAAAIVGLADAVAAGPAPAWRACDGAACWSIAEGAIVRVAADGRVEERRPAFLADARVDAAAAHGGSLWLGLSAARDGRPAPLGLVRYDWDRGRAQVFRGADTGPCGFFVLDVAVRGGTLWVTTDLGTSRLGLAAEWDEWAHFRAAGDGLEETACATLLATALEEAAEPDAIRKRVQEFRPRFWKRYRKRRPA